MYQHCLLSDELQFEKFSDLFDWERMVVEQTENGLFLTIKLSDGYYGDPEYKIYT